MKAKKYFTEEEIKDRNSIFEKKLAMLQMKNGNVKNVIQFMNLVGLILVLLLKEKI